MEEREKWHLLNTRMGNNWGRGEGVATILKKDPAPLGGCSGGEAEKGGGRRETALSLGLVRKGENTE